MVMVGPKNPVPPPERVDVDSITSTSEAKETLQGLRGTGPIGKHSGGTVPLLSQMMELTNVNESTGPSPLPGEQTQ